jgi:hypothetical protein
MGVADTSARGLVDAYTVPPTPPVTTNSCALASMVAAATELARLLAREPEGTRAPLTYKLELEWAALGHTGTAAAHEEV